MKTKQALRSAGRQGTQCAFGPDVRGAAVLPARPGDGLPAVPAPPASLACVPHHFPTQHRPDPWDSVCTPRSLPTSRRVRRRTQDSCVHAAPWPHPVRWGPLFPPREGPMAQLVRPQVSARPQPGFLAHPPPRDRVVVVVGRLGTDGSHVEDRARLADGQQPPPCRSTAP